MMSTTDAGELLPGSRSSSYESHHATPQQQHRNRSASLTIPPDPNAATPILSPSTMSRTATLLQHENAFRSFVPLLLEHRLANHDNYSPLSEPLCDAFVGALLFVDMSGFTPLSERLSALGMIGIESLSAHLNHYFGNMVDIIHRYHGDIVKFAGDALMIVFAGLVDESIQTSNNYAGSDITDPAVSDIISALTHRACSCALAIHNEFDCFSPAKGVTLRLHSAISAGKMFSVHVGGHEGRWEWLVRGQPITHIGIAMHDSQMGQIILHSSAHHYVSRLVTSRPLTDDNSECHLLITDTLPPADAHSHINRNKAAHLTIIVPPLTPDKLTVRRSTSNPNPKEPSLNVSGDSVDSSALYDHVSNKASVGNNVRQSALTVTYEALFHRRLALVKEGASPAIDTDPYRPVHMSIVTTRAVITEEEDIRCDMAVRAYVPSAVVARVAAGHRAWLAEFRRVTTLFILLPEYTLDSAPTEIERRAMHANFQKIILAIMKICATHKGDIRQLITDDKGTVMILLFGLQADWANPVRGVTAALDIADSMKTLGLTVAIGVTTGKVFCGTVGNHLRCEYTAVGDKVNTSARLMMAVPNRDGIYVDAETVQSIGLVSLIAFKPLTPIKVKGKAEAVPIFSPYRVTLVNRQHVAPRVIDRRWKEHLSGRNLQRQDINAFIVRQTPFDRTNLLFIESLSHGMGRKGLMSAAYYTCRENCTWVLVGVANGTESTPYFAFHGLVLTLLKSLHLLKRKVLATQKSQAGGVEGECSAEEFDAALLNDSVIKEDAAVEDDLSQVEWLTDPDSLYVDSALVSDGLLTLLNDLCPLVNFQHTEVVTYTAPTSARVSSNASPALPSVDPSPLHLSQTPQIVHTPQTHAASLLSPTHVGHRHLNGSVSASASTSTSQQTSPSRLTNSQQTTTRSASTYSAVVKRVDRPPAIIPAQNTFISAGHVISPTEISRQFALQANGESDKKAAQKLNVQSAADVKSAATPTDGHLSAPALAPARSSSSTVPLRTTSSVSQKSVTSPATPVLTPTLTPNAGVTAKSIPTGGVARARAIQQLLIKLLSQLHFGIDGQSDFRVCILIDNAQEIDSASESLILSLTKDLPWLLAIFAAVRTDTPCALKKALTPYSAELDAELQAKVSARTVSETSDIVGTDSVGSGEIKMTRLRRGYTSVRHTRHNSITTPMTTMQRTATLLDTYQHPKHHHHHYHHRHQHTHHTHAHRKNSMERLEAEEVVSDQGNGHDDGDGEMNAADDGGGATQLSNRTRSVPHHRSGIARSQTVARASHHHHHHGHRHHHHRHGARKSTRNSGDDTDPRSQPESPPTDLSQLAPLPNAYNYSPPNANADQLQVDVNAAFSGIQSANISPSTSPSASTPAALPVIGPPPLTRRSSLTSMESSAAASSLTSSLLYPLAASPNLAKSASTNASDTEPQTLLRTYTPARWSRTANYSLPRSTLPLPPPVSVPVSRLQHTKSNSSQRSVNAAEVTKIAAIRLCYFVELGPLTLDETADLLRNILKCQRIDPRVVAVIHEKAGGVPLYADELAQSMLSSRIIIIQNDVVGNTSLTHRSSQLHLNTSGSSSGTQTPVDTPHAQQPTVSRHTSFSTSKSVQTLSSMFSHTTTQQTTAPAQVQTATPSVSSSSMSTAVVGETPKLQRASLGSQSLTQIAAPAQLFCTFNAFHNGRELDLSSLPDSMNEMIAARIDALSPDPQLLIKICAVFGRIVDTRCVRRVWKLFGAKRVRKRHDKPAAAVAVAPTSEGKLSQVNETEAGAPTSKPPLESHTSWHRNADRAFESDMAVLVAKGFLSEQDSSEETCDLDGNCDRTYVFKHAICVDVAYARLPFSFRGTLHRAIAEWYEEEYATNLSSYYSKLAFHWSQAAAFIAEPSATPITSTPSPSTVTTGSAMSPPSTTHPPSPSYSPPDTPNDTSTTPHRQSTGSNGSTPSASGSTHAHRLVDVRLRAIHYLKVAGESAITQHARKEAVRWLGKAIELIQALADKDSLMWKRELLHVMALYAPTYATIIGFGRAVDVFSKLCDLCEDVQRVTHSDDTTAATPPTVREGGEWLPAFIGIVEREGPNPNMEFAKETFYALRGFWFSVGQSRKSEFRLSDGRGLVDRMVAIADESGDPEMIKHSRHVCAIQSLLHADYDECLDFLAMIHRMYIERVPFVVNSYTPLDPNVAALNLNAHICMARGQMLAALEYTDSAVAMATKHGEPVAYQQAIIMHCFISHQLDRDDASYDKWYEHIQTTDTIISSVLFEILSGLNSIMETGEDVQAVRELADTIWQKYLDGDRVYIAFGSPFCQLMLLAGYWENGLEYSAEWEKETDDGAAGRHCYSEKLRYEALFLLQQAEALEWECQVARRRFSIESISSIDQIIIPDDNSSASSTITSMSSPVSEVSAPSAADVRVHARKVLARSVRFAHADGVLLFEMKSLMAIIPVLKVIISLQSTERAEDYQSRPIADVSDMTEIDRERCQADMEEDEVTTDMMLHAISVYEAQLASLVEEVDYNGDFIIITEAKEMLGMETGTKTFSIEVDSAAIPNAVTDEHAIVTEHVENQQILTTLQSMEPYTNG